MAVRDYLIHEALRVYDEVFKGLSGRVDDTWHSCEYQGVLFDINVYVDEELTGVYATAYLVFTDAMGYVSTDTSAWFPLGLIGE